MHVRHPFRLRPPVLVRGPIHVCLLSLVKYQLLPSLPSLPYPPIGSILTMLPYYLVLTALVKGPVAFLALTCGTYGTLASKHEPLRAPLSRVGSGAPGYSPPLDPALAPPTQVSPRSLRSWPEASPEGEGSPRAAVTHRGYLQVEAGHLSAFNHHTLIMFVAEIALPLTIIFLFILMNHGRHEAQSHGMPQLSSANFTHRVPPMWSPETETQYSFRSYMTDLSLWIMLTDLQPPQQASAIVMRLGGAARDMARLIPPKNYSMEACTTEFWLTPLHS